MKTLTLLILAIILPLQSPRGAEWKDFSSKTGKFTVLLPGTPVDDSTEDALRYKLNIGPRVYGIIVTGTFEKRGSSPNEIMNNLADEFMTVSKGKLINRATVKASGYTGVSIKYETVDPPGITEARYYLVNNRLYQLIAFTRNGNSEDNAQKFLNSFRLLQK